MFATGEVEENLARRKHYFGLRQQASGMFIGLFVGGVIAPILMVADPERLHRGLFLIAISAVLILVGAVAWFRLPKDQRTFKALRSPP